MNSFKETRSRSTKKSISWRVIAFSNSWFVLAVGLTDIPLWNAIIMNVTGMVMFYFHERIWNRINDGKYKN
jgi:uncharacterized membrane protein|tara:strand:- start:48 stop:260 length:213 start_codon:yes stop_codon:yes gene_type:complete